MDFPEKNATFESHHNPGCYKVTVDRGHGRGAIGLIVDMGEKQWSGKNMEVHPGQQIKNFVPFLVLASQTKKNLKWISRKKYDVRKPSQSRV